MFSLVTEGNLEAAARVHAESWRESHRGFCTAGFVAAHTTARQMEYIRKEMAQGRCFYLLILDGPKGIVSVWRDLIENLYILPGEQRRGYGTKLLHFAEGLCTGIPRLWVLSNNIAAQAFYLRCGYVFTGGEKQLSGNLAELEMARAAS